MKYTLSMKMAEALSDRGILMLLGSLRFHYGFGDASIAEVCRHNGYPEQVFLMLANACTDPSYRPELKSLTHSDAMAIVDYVRRSHRFFSEDELPYIHSLIHDMLDGEDKAFADVLNRYFDELLENVNAHFEAEEKALDSGQMTIPEEKQEHYDFIEKLDDLKNLIIRYLPDRGEDNRRFITIMNLMDLENSLRAHMLIEEKILLPIEAKLGRQEVRGEVRQDSLPTEILSQREKEIVCAVAHGKTNKEIADELFISMNTVITHRKNIARKTGINSIAGLTAYAILNGIVSLNELNNNN